jgi:aerobic-type carbon monoxide dehydrogenase small subunit (CoxS/CutS family)
MRIAVEVNGAHHVVDAPPLARLLDVLRDDLGLTGAKEGCGEGECGACTVLLDGAPVVSCLVPVCHADGHRVTTVEGVADGDVLGVVQDALDRHGAVQCGFCTPGIVLAAMSALERDPGAGRAEIREALAGNLCRCTGYQLVVDAVADAAAAAQQGRA